MDELLKNITEDAASTKDRLECIRRSLTLHRLFHLREENQSEVCDLDRKDALDPGSIILEIVRTRSIKLWKVLCKFLAFSFFHLDARIANYYGSSSIVSCAHVSQVCQDCPIYSWKDYIGQKLTGWNSHTHRHMHKTTFHLCTFSFPYLLSVCLKWGRVTCAVVILSYFRESLTFAFYWKMLMERLCSHFLWYLKLNAKFFPNYSSLVKHLRFLSVCKQARISFVLERFRLFTSREYDLLCDYVLIRVWARTTATATTTPENDDKSKCDTQFSSILWRSLPNNNVKFSNL